MWADMLYYPRTDDDQSPKHEYTAPVGERKVVCIKCGEWLDHPPSKELWFHIIRAPLSGILHNLTERTGPVLISDKTFNKVWDDNPYDGDSHLVVEEDFVKEYAARSGTSIEEARKVVESNFQAGKIYRYHFMCTEMLLIRPPRDENEMMDRFRSIWDRAFFKGGVTEVGFAFCNYDLYLGHPYDSKMIFRWAARKGIIRKNKSNSNWKLVQATR